MFLFLLLLPPSAAGRYATEQQALDTLFPQHTHSVTLSSWAQIPMDVLDGLRTHKAMHEARFEGEFKIFKMKNGSDETAGWAVLTEEFGMHQPITFMVGVLPDGQVSGVVLMVFRESRGNGIKHKRFRKQFRGKTIDDPLRIRRDLINVSGSTISSRAMARGVKKVLLLTQAVCQQP